MNKVARMASPDIPISGKSHAGRPGTWGAGLEVERSGVEMAAAGADAIVPVGTGDI